MSKEEKEAWKQRFIDIAHSDEAKLWMQQQKEAYLKMKETAISNNEKPMTWNEFQRYYKSLPNRGFSKKKKQ